MLETIATIDILTISAYTTDNLLYVLDPLMYRYLLYDIHYTISRRNFYCDNHWYFI